FGNYNYRESFPNANAGAVVALDVKSGDVLAMVSYPAFDPNLFALGISEKNWNSLQDKNPRDPLSPIPLFNIATRTAVQPGSTFKMLVGLAAMESGLDANTRFYDGGVIRLGDKLFRCNLWKNRRASHGYVNLMDAIEVSCNYYFYDIMSAYDYYRAKPIPIDMTINDVMDLVSKFGLGERTGIEIPEAYVGVPSEEKKIAVTKSSLKNKLKSRGAYYFGTEIVSDEALFEEKMNTIVSWTEENPSRNELIKRLKDVGALPEKIYELADLIKYSYFNMASWGTGDMLNLAIGQGEHAYTPLQMANYTATLVNGGYKNEITLIKGVEDSIDEEIEDDTLGYQIDLNYPSNLEYIKIGMNRVASGSRGTARGVFGSFDIPIGGKTGTAERSGKIQPVDEVEYIKKYLKWINPRISFVQVEQEMNRLLAEYPENYSKTRAVRKAVINLSGGRVTEKTLDAYKPDYEDFAWFVSFAPYDEPEIAVAVLIFQGGHGGYAAPVAKEVIAEYLGLNDEYSEFSLENHYTE
ncbi:MAG: penicillin-binding protein, partial [Clostridia bacterium]|nr:penicillin-binding protein [Clostridia bacterium]